MHVEEVIETGLETKVRVTAHQLPDIEEYWKRNESCKVMESWI